MMFTLSILLPAVQAALTDDLRRRSYRGDPNPLTGHCYVAAEALYHLRGGIDTPVVARCPDGDTHWWLRTSDGTILDPTAGQFPGPFPYERGRGSGFLTKQPSARALVVIERVMDTLIAEEND